VVERNIKIVRFECNHVNQPFSERPYTYFQDHPDYQSRCCQEGLQFLCQNSDWLRTEMSFQFYLWWEVKRREKGCFARASRVPKKSLYIHKSITQFHMVNILHYRYYKAESIQEANDVQISEVFCSVRTNLEELTWLHNDSYRLTAPDSYTLSSGLHSVQSIHVVQHRSLKFGIRKPPLQSIAIWLGKPPTHHKDPHARGHFKLSVQ
jgi:hypothetical protein